MSILDKNVIDGLAYENETIIMEIYDHLDWREEYYHLSALQDKINSYLAYIESKQYEEKYKNVDKIIVNICFMHLVNDNCRKFIDTVNTKVKELNCEFIIKEDPYTSLEELYNTFNQENKTGNLNYENKNNPHIEWIFDNDNVLYIDRNIIKYRYSKKTLFKNKVLENSIDISMINENDVYNQIYHILEKSKILYERQKTLEGL